MSKHQIRLELIVLAVSREKAEHRNVGRASCGGLPEAHHSAFRANAALLKRARVKRYFTFQAPSVFTSVIVVRSLLPGLAKSTFANVGHS